MSKKVYRPVGEDVEYLAKFAAVLQDRLALYEMAIEKAQEIFEDDRAVQACAYTLYRETLDIMNSPREVYLPGASPEENLRQFALYRQTQKDPYTAFVELCVAYYQDDSIGVEDVRDLIKNHIMMQRDMFNSIVNYLVLAQYIKHTIMLTRDDISTKEHGKLTAGMDDLMFGRTPGKSVDEIVKEEKQPEPAPISLDDALGAW